MWRQSPRSQAPPSLRAGLLLTGSTPLLSARTGGRVVRIPRCVMVEGFFSALTRRRLRRGAARRSAPAQKLSTQGRSSTSQVQALRGWVARAQ